MTGKVSINCDDIWTHAMDDNTDIAIAYQNIDMPDAESNISKGKSSSTMIKKGKVTLGALQPALVSYVQWCFFLPFCDIENRH
jgi:hypothetical protein